MKPAENDTYRVIHYNGCCPDPAQVGLVGSLVGYSRCVALASELAAKHPGHSYAVIRVEVVGVAKGAIPEPELPANYREVGY
jgi:hypothetical protein